MKSSEISGLEKHRTRNFCIGLIASLSFAVGAINYTTFEKPNYNIYDVQPTEVEEVNVIRTPPQKKKVLPPPPKMTIADKIEIEDVVEFIEEEPPKLEETLDEKIVEKDEVAYVPKPTPQPQPKPVAPELIPPEPEVEIDEYVTFAENMPRFPGCEETNLLKKDKEVCAQKNMLAFIYSKIKYPPIARQNGIEGTVVIQFIVNKDGGIADLKIVKDIGGGCGKEALRVVKQMPDWIPGSQGGRKVKVQYNLSLIHI